MSGVGAVVRKHLVDVFDHTRLHRGVKANVLRLTSADSPYTLDGLTRYIIGDLSTGDITVKLPADPNRQSQYYFQVGVAVTGNKLIVDGNGKTIQGLPTGDIWQLLSWCWVRFDPEADEWMTRFGSGGEEPRLVGWQEFRDQGIVKPTIEDISGGTVTLTNDADGVTTSAASVTNASSSPTGIDDIWNSTTNYFNFIEAGLEENDMVDIRLDIEVTPGIVPHEAMVDMVFFSEKNGGGSEQFRLGLQLPLISSQAGVGHSHVFVTPVFIGPTISTDGSMRMDYTCNTDVVITVVAWFCPITIILPQE